MGAVSQRGKPQISPQLHTKLNAIGEKYLEQSNLGPELAEMMEIVSWTREHAANWGTKTTRRRVMQNAAKKARALAAALAELKSPFLQCVFSGSGSEPPTVRGHQVKRRLPDLEVPGFEELVAAVRSLAVALESFKDPYEPPPANRPAVDGALTMAVGFLFSIWERSMKSTARARTQKAFAAFAAEVIALPPLEYEAPEIIYATRDFFRGRKEEEPLRMLAGWTE
jgi:hypothetical protein